MIEMIILITCGVWFAGCMIYCQITSQSIRFNHHLKKYSNDVIEDIINEKYKECTDVYNVNIKMLNNIHNGEFLCYPGNPDPWMGTIMGVSKKEELIMRYDHCCERLNELKKEQTELKGKIND